MQVKAHLGNRRKGGLGRGNQISKIGHAALMQMVILERSEARMETNSQHLAQDRQNTHGKCIRNTSNSYDGDAEQI